jgi:hypothetical protein
MSDIKLQRTIARFQAKIDSGSYYEAHQTLRTITNRYVKAGQFEEAVDLLYQGSLILAKKGEFASATDLITYLIQVYTEAGYTSQQKDYKVKLVELISHLPDGESSLIDLCKQATGWSKTAENQFGDNDLHHFFGVKFLNHVKNGDGEGVIRSEDDRLKLFGIAELHLILGTYESLPVYVEYLAEWATGVKGPKSDGSELSTTTTDYGLFLGRAILNYAYLKNIKFVKEARDIFFSIVKDRAQYEVVKEGDLETYIFPEHPLLNFLQLLVITLSLENVPANGKKFMSLYNQYKELLKITGVLGGVEYLGDIYFDLKIGGGNGGGGLASLMGNLFS